MREGTRYIFFRYLVQNIPTGTNKMVGSAGVNDEIEAMLIHNYTDDLIEMCMKTFDKWETGVGRKRYDSFEELLENTKVLGGREGALKWAARWLILDEITEASEWLEENGYVRIWKKPAPFGHRVYFGVTKKGWAIAHMYK